MEAYDVAYVGVLFPVLHAACSLLDAYFSFSSIWFPADKTDEDDEDCDVMIN